MRPRNKLAHAHRDHAESGNDCLQPPPKPFAAELELELTAYELIATRGRSVQRFPLTAIERVTLRFSPRNTAHRAFACTVRATDGKSVTFDSLSWKSLIETEKQNDDYTRFVSALCARAEAARPQVELVSGVPSWKFWGMLVAGIGVLGGLVAITFIRASTEAGSPLASPWRFLPISLSGCAITSGETARPVSGPRRCHRLSCPDQLRTTRTEQCAWRTMFVAWLPMR